MFPAVGILDDDVRADDVGRHQIRRELDARERQLETLRQGLDEQRLAEPGNALEQHVAAREHADEDVVDDLAVAYDDFFDLRTQAFERRHELSYAAVVGHRLSSPWMTLPGPTAPGLIISASYTPNPDMRCDPQARVSATTG